MNAPRQTALVLGGVKGIGKALALDLASQGMAVAVNYFDWEDSLPKLEHDLKNSGAPFLILKNNLLESQSNIPAMVRTVTRHFGRLDVLVNNIERGGWPIVHGHYTQDQWDLEMETTLRAKRWAFESALPHLVESGDGLVINISSIAGVTGRSGPAGLVFNDGYAAANRAVSSLTETWARTAAPKVRVNEIMLGLFETRHGPGTRGWEILSDEQKKAILDHTLLGRTGVMDDVIKAVRFLLHDAPFMTGSVLRLDGGYVLGGDPVPSMPKGVVKPGESVFGR
ncbi:SDR family NAD(P)-dependent oxidoreductase [Desulfatibacillum aliphaticivorans]|uniref:SDR family NAD(P)-dependent oxidoreductase n=1 Tax=Desulfatibacillum aliphaticivorans TaxID=218208 RepID=UPI000426AD05|nr:SDR family oxidoreductase [Desulfatibacillum aliphaticivorans]